MRAGASYAVANDDNEAYWKDQLYTFDYDSFAQTCADMQKMCLRSEA